MVIVFLLTWSPGDCYSSDMVLVGLELSQHQTSLSITPSIPNYKLFWLFWLPQKYHNLPREGWFSYSTIHPNPYELRWIGV